MKQITLEEALKLVSFCYEGFMGWQVRDVKCDVWGDVHGNVRGGVTAMSVVTSGAMSEAPSQVGGGNL